MNCCEFTQCGRGHEGECPSLADNGDICAEIMGTFWMDKDRILAINAIKLKDFTKCSFFNSIHYKGRKEL